MFCASSLTIDNRYLELAAEVGVELAGRGHSLVSGGGSISSMGALARAVRAGGARTTGVIPRALADLEVADLDADELVVTDDMRQRKGVMDRMSDGFLALPGGIGTIEELLEVWTARSLGMHRKPVVVCDPWGDLSPLRDLVDGLVAAGFVRGAAADDVRWVTSAAEALDALESAWAAAPGAPEGHGDAALRARAAEALEAD